MPDIPIIKRFSRLKIFELKTDRPALVVEGGMTARGVAMPRPDPVDALTYAAGAYVRYLRRPPESNPALLARLRKFVRRILREEFEPLDPMSDLSVPAWLEKTNYPLWRRQEL